MKQVLYLSYDGMTDPLGQGQVLSYLQGLSSKDLRITLISFEKPERFANKKPAIELICRTAGIDWQPLMYTKKPPVFSTVYDIFRMWRRAKKLQAQKKFSAVHCRSYLPALAGLAMNKKFRTAFIFDMRGFWIDEKIETGEWDSKKVIYKSVIKFLRKKEKEFYCRADSIVTLTQASKQIIIDKYPALQHRISVIPTCVNLAIFKSFQPAIRIAVRKKLGIPENAFVLLYSGGYGANYDIHFLLKLFNKLKEIYPETCLLILSKDGITGLEQSIAGQNIVTVSLPYEKVSDYLMAGDLGAINYVNRFSVAARSPTKLGEYWACGLPAVSPEGVGDVDMLFKTYRNSGIIYREDDFTNKLNEVRNAEKDALRSYAMDYFSLEKGIRLYRSVYEIF